MLTARTAPHPMRATPEMRNAMDVAQRARERISSVILTSYFVQRSLLPSQPSGAGLDSSDLRAFLGVRGPCGIAIVNRAGWRATGGASRVLGATASGIG